VKPASREELEGKERKFSDKMPFEAQKYLIVNDTDVFVYARYKTSLIFSSIQHAI
jgi:hypothetical protein